MTKSAFILYQFLWTILAPLLRFHKRMKIGYKQRILKTPLPKVDLWIQAASVGEAYLVTELLNILAPEQATSVLVTTNTSQGFEILEKMKPASPHITLTIRYCPFDHPRIIFKAITMAKPKLMVLIETELWPGLLSGCQQNNIPVLVVNGRMTEKSMKGYLRFASLWQNIGPRHILAMSQTDAERFQAVFGEDRVSTMFNIKFDRLLHSAVLTPGKPAFPDIIPALASFLILGSIREEEEDEVSQMLEALLQSQPDLILGLFPRHMERINAWRHIFHQSKRAYQLRSEISKPVPQGTIILWDTIGELGTAYGRADGVFVGGSLASLGGQNFLEPLSAGIRPVTGPSLSDFHWVGTEIFQNNMVIKAENGQDAVKALLQEFQQKTDKQKIQADFQVYAKARQGGTATACRKILDMSR